MNALQLTSKTERAGEKREGAGPGSKRRFHTIMSLESDDGAVVFNFSSLRK